MHLYTTLPLVLALALSSPALAQVFTRKIGPYELVVTSKEDQTAVLEISPVTADTVKLFTLPSPRRLVLDLPPQPSVKSGSLGDLSSSLVQRVRVGTHHDRTRIVLDVEGQRLRYAHRIEGETSIIAIAAGRSSARPAEVRTRKDISDVTNSRRGDTSSHPLVSPPQVKGEQDPPLAPPGRGVAMPSGNGGPKGTETKETSTGPDTSDKGDRGPSFKAIEFHGDLSLVRIALSTRSPFGVVKKNAREYVISIPDATLTSEALTLDHFPPRELVGFTYVRGRVVGNNLHVEIGVDPNTKLSAIPEDMDIVLRASREN